MKIQLAILLLAATLSACDESATTPSAVTNVSSLAADQVIYGLHHVISKNGIRSSQLDADSAYERDAGRTLELFHLHLTFYGEDGAQSGQLTAGRGSYQIESGDFFARDNVVLVTTETTGQRTIETSELNYQTKTDQLWSEKPFVMREGGRVTKGTSFHSDRKLNTWTATNIETSGGLPQGSGGLSF